MKLPLLLLLFLQVATPPEKASIAGSVLRASSGEPLARAEVRLSRVPSDEGAGQFISNGGEDNADFPTVQTGNDGKFLLKDLEPGQYRMTVSRNGYAQQSYGSKNASRPGSIINLAAGEKKTDIVFRLQPAGVITGRVRDSSGDPVAGYGVTLLKASYSNDRQFLYQEDSTQTDDRGEYRFYWIPPGRYYIRVSPPRLGEFEMRRIVIDKSAYSAFYPGVHAVSDASAIELTAGAEMGAVDIVLPRITGYHVRGRIVEASTGQPPKSASVSIRPKKAGVFEYGFDGSDGVEYNSRTGEFELRNVVPGSYLLSAYAQNQFDGLISPERLAEVRTGEDIFEAVFASGASAEITLEMNSEDASGIVLLLKKGATIPARISIEGTELTSIKGWEDIRLTLAPEYSGTNFRRSSRPSVDGTERIENVTPGQYRVDVDSPPAANLYVKEVLYGRSDALTGPIEIDEQAGGAITVLLSPNGGQVEGRLTDAQSQPVSGADVMLIPDDRERSRLYRTAITDRDGRFTFRAIPPGSYKLFSWEDLDTGEYYSKQVISKYETEGRPVRIQESLKQSVDVKIIPAPKP
jgi:5-hydroxyisourate hydrolase-like protein (transthyretin family)